VTTLPVPINWHATLPAHLRTDDAFTRMASLGAAFESRAFARVSTDNNTFSLVSIDGDRMQVNQIDQGAVFLDLVFINWADHITKTWYEGAYTAGSDVAPSCFSMDGIKPDVSSPVLQSPTCAACPKNAFGSAANGKGKACSDGQRTAVVLGADTPVMLNSAPHVLKAGAEVYGYRLPPMTGKNLRAKVKEAQKAGVNLMGVVMRAKFVAQGEVDFTFLSYLGEGPWLHTRKLAETDECLRAIGKQDEPAKIYDAIPDHLRSAGAQEHPRVREIAGQAAAPLTTPPAGQAETPKRTRGRPPATSTSPVPATTGTPTLATALGGGVPAQNGVIQTPTPASSALEDLLAQAMA
jgi:hypothetical protein